jgi:hypothetical protein
VKILVINGAGHSGSTLVDCVLGSYPGVVAVGEIRRIWRYGAVDNRRCACGQRFLACPFWTEVGREAFGGWDRQFARDQLRTQERLLTGRALLRLRSGRLRSEQGEALAQFAASRRALVEAVGKVANAQLIVDSSKSGPYGAALARVPGLDVRGLHLTRDSRGFAYSAIRRRRGGSLRFPGIGARGLARLSAWWAVRNLGAEAAWAGSRRAMRYRYEAFAADPGTAAARLLGFAGVPIRPEPGRTAFPLADTHSLAGNPLRFESGELTVRLDDAWRRQMPPASRRLVTALTAPFLLRYGYFRRM